MDIQATNRWKFAREFCVCLLLVAAIAGLLYPVFVRPTVRYHGGNSLSKVKQFAVATLIYAADYDECFPPDPGIVAKGLLSKGFAPYAFPFTSAVGARESIESVLYVYYKNVDLRISPEQIPIRSPQFKKGGATWHELFGSDFGWNDYDLIRGFNAEREKDVANTLLIYQMEPSASGPRAVAYMDGHGKYETAPTFAVRLKTHPYWFLP